MSARSHMSSGATEADGKNHGLHTTKRRTTQSKSMAVIGSSAVFHYCGDAVMYPDGTDY